jgi:peptidyl-prolyl cis-trans isomerase C
MDVLQVVMKRTALAAVAGAMLALTVTALADNKVLARVDGKDITEADVNLAKSELGPNLGSIPSDQRTSALVGYIIDNKLMAAAAEKAGFGSDASLQARLDYYKGRAMRDLYFDKTVLGAVTDADAKAIYDKKVAEIKPVEEIHAVHILVEKKEEADDIVAKLKAGGDFAALAKEKSKDTGSGAAGGDLGFFAKGQMVKPFEDAAWALKDGEISAPVQSQFGWHVIKLLEKRNKPAPTFDSVKDTIVNGLVQQKMQEAITGLHKGIKIEYVDEALKKAADAGQLPQ